MAAAQRREDENARRPAAAIVERVGAVFALGKADDVARAQLALAPRRAQSGRARDDDGPLFVADVEVIRPELVAGLELVERATPERGGESLAETLGFVVEEVQKPIPSSAGSGLVGSPGRGPPSLYSDGATSFGPSG